MEREATAMLSEKSSASAFELMAVEIERVALSAGPLSELPPQFWLPRATWHAVLRSRRMRVFDWMVDAGFRLLNLLPCANSAFLAYAERCELQSKYSIARNLWLSMREDVEDGAGWLNALAHAEILLVELREPRHFAGLPFGETDAVTLSSGVRLAQVVPETLPLHDSIPQFSLPASVAATELSQLRQRFPTRPPVLQDVLFVPGSGDEPEGRLIQLEDALVAALSATTDKRLSVADLRDKIGCENLASLIKLGALSRCDL
jgi:hypothetical protein